MKKIMGGQVLEFDWDIEYRRQMSMAREEGLESGMRQGLERGLEQGSEYKMLSLICRKLHKGKPVDVIADELEEEPECIEHICRVAERFAPEYDVEKIYNELHMAKV